MRIRRCAQTCGSLNSGGQAWSARHCGQQAWRNVDLGADSAFRDPSAGIRTAVRILQTFRMMLLRSRCRHVCPEHAAFGFGHGFSEAIRLFLGALLGTAAAPEGWPHSRHEIENRASCSYGLASVKLCWPGAIELHTRFSAIVQLCCAALPRCARSHAVLPRVSNQL